MLSAGVAALPDKVKAAALQFMMHYHNFTPQNGPHGGHDFGAFELCNRRFSFGGFSFLNGLTGTFWEPINRLAHFFLGSTRGDTHEGLYRNRTYCSIAHHRKLGICWT